MKKLTLLLIHLLIVVSAIAQNNIRYTTVNLNLREDTITSAKVIKVLPKGTAVKIDEDCDCSWILVSYQGKVGFVYSKYLSKTKPTSVQHSTVKHYTNSAGERVQSPTYYDSAPAGATAICRDGTYSYSRSRRGTCSHHGGVKVWL